VPVWFAQMGGFEKSRNLFYFERFVHKVAKELTSDVKYILTVNEPNVYASFSYQLGLRPPQKKNLLLMLRVYRNLAKTHRRSYYILKHEKPSLQIGVAAQLANIQAKRAHSFKDEFVTQWMRYAWNWWFLQRIRREQDFIGLNYYFTDYYRNKLPPKPENPKLPLNDLGWYMEPEGIYPLLLRIWAHYKKPIIITENGVADSQDQYRRWWLEETIVAMERAMSEGVKIVGYLHWSLLDNFEWEMGWWPKFGLIEVDRKTMKRKIRPSAQWFAAHIKRLQQ
jgi:beta-glucosidase